MEPLGNPGEKIRLTLILQSEQQIELSIDASVEKVSHVRLANDGKRSVPHAG